MEPTDVKRRAEHLERLFDRAPMKHTFKMHLHFDDDGQAHFHMPHQSHFEHGLHDTHGGVIATLLDNAGWFTAALHYDTWVNTAELTVRLHEPANREALTAVGRMVRAGSKLAVTTMEVRSETHRLIATGSASFIVSSRSTDVV